MKLLVKFEIKFLNFFTLKNLNNKKIYFLLPKNTVYTFTWKKANCLGAVHKHKQKCTHKSTVHF